MENNRHGNGSKDKDYFLYFQIFAVYFIQLSTAFSLCLSARGKTLRRFLKTLRRFDQNAPSFFLNASTFFPVLFWVKLQRLGMKKYFLRHIFYKPPFGLYKSNGGLYKSNGDL